MTIARAVLTRIPAERTETRWSWREVNVTARGSRPTTNVPTAMMAQSRRRTSMLADFVMVVRML